jgi:predicted DNA-binding transcriptional regulator AlpA
MQGKSDNETNPNRLVTEHEAADMLCYSVRALQNWRHRGGGPRFVKVSARSVRYRIADLHDWIEARTVAHTSETT